MALKGLERATGDRGLRTMRIAARRCGSLNNGEARVRDSYNRMTDHRAMFGAPSIGNTVLFSGVTLYCARLNKEVACLS